MTFLELAKKRQSTRAYAPRPIPREALERCLEAARLAPSACNSQEWHFIVVDEPKLKDTLFEKAFSGIYAMNAFVKKAPVIIAVITERSSYTARLGGFFKGVRYNLIDIGIACEHLVLQAAEEGIGSCYVGWFNEKAVKEVLHLGKKTKVDLLISVGYPEKEGIRVKLRKNIEEIIRFNLER